MSTNNFWTTTHGMVFGFIFLLGFAGALVGVYMMNAEWLTTEGVNVNVNVNRLRIFLWLLAAAVWAAIFTGTYIIYPVYRAVPPEGLTDLVNFPHFLLLPTKALSFGIRLAWNGSNTPPLFRRWLPQWLLLQCNTTAQHWQEA